MPDSVPIHEKGWPSTSDVALVAVIEQCEEALEPEVGRNG